MSFIKKRWVIFSHEVVRIFLTLSSIFLSGRERCCTVRLQQACRSRRWVSKGSSPSSPP